MYITIYGTGYVGLVTGTCLAELGHQVLCIDINQEKIASLKQGIVPIYEPGLEELIKKNVTAGKLDFSDDPTLGVKHGLIQFICVNTPADNNGAADIRNVLTAARVIAENMQEYRLIINKSTAPVGTAAKIKEILQENLANKPIDFDVASNPEFLKEGSAIQDFLNPDRVIIGVENERAKAHLAELYQPFFQQQKLIAMDIVSAELTKYAANAMLATRISFINEIANLSDRLGADINHIRKGIGLDPRIGPHFIAPGCGYGGSCFPKDIKALIHTAKSEGVELKILSAVESVNKQQKHVLFEKINQHFKGQLANLTFALWGLAFKPNTDDIRDATSHIILEDLWQAGAIVKAYDPVAQAEITKLYGKRNNLILCDTAEACLDNAQALIIVTEWPQFCNFDLKIIKNTLVNPVIFDGRNIFDLKQLGELGFEYYGIGRQL